MNEKTLSEHILCECKCKFDGRKCNSDQCRNNEKCRVNKVMYMTKIIFGFLLHVVVKMRKILLLIMESIMNDSAITCDEFLR